MWSLNIAISLHCNFEGIMHQVLEKCETAQRPEGYETIFCAIYVVCSKNIDDPNFHDGSLFSRPDSGK